MTRPQRTVYHLCRILLGGAFPFAGLLAAALPWLEILAGGLLLAHRHVRAACLVLAALTTLFVAALLSVLARGLEVDCGCFGASVAVSPVEALLRDVLILVAAHMVFHLRPLYERLRDA